MRRCVPNGHKVMKTETKGKFPMRKRNTKHTNLSDLLIPFLKRFPFQMPAINYLKFAIILVKHLHGTVYATTQDFSDSLYITVKKW